MGTPSWGLSDGSEVGKMGCEGARRPGIFSIPLAAPRVGAARGGDLTRSPLEAVCVDRLTGFASARMNQLGDQKHQIKNKPLKGLEMWKSSF